MSLGCACSVGRRWPAYDTLPAVSLTVVVENRAGHGCTGAHGLAVWLEAGDAALLVDTGPEPGLLAANAARLGLDLGRVEAVVLSHGHDDHSGGLPAVVAARRGRPLTVALHPEALRPRYSRRSGSPRFIGMPQASLTALNMPGVSRLETLRPTGLVPGVWATGPVPRLLSGAQERHLVRDPAGHDPDPLDDDQAVVVDTIHGLVVICGCAHAGVANTLEHIAAVRPGAPIAALVGGFHLGSSEPAAVGDLADALRAHAVARCACGHCTGAAAERILGDRLGERLATITCGTAITIP